LARLPAKPSTDYKLVYNPMTNNAGGGRTRLAPGLVSSVHSRAIQRA